MAKESSKSKRLFSALEVIGHSEVLVDGPVYVVFGGEEFLKLEAQAAIRQMVLGEGPDEFAQTYMDASTATLADVLDALATRPFLSPRRLVVLADADEFVSRHRDALERYCDKPQRSGILLLSVQSWPANTRLARKVNSMGVAIDCRAPDTARLPSWCRQWARQRYGKELRADAAQLLVELGAAGVGQLDQELSKLASYVGKRKAIDAGDVDQLVASGRVELVWKILGQATAGNAGAALEAMNSILSAGEHPLMVFGALNAQLRRLLRAHRLSSLGMDIAEAMSQAGIRPFAMRETQQRLSHLGPKRLDALYDQLLATDMGLKGASNIPAQHLLERLIVQLAAPR